MKKEIKVRVGTKLGEFRRAKNITLSHLSELSGVQLATLSRIENNKMTGTLETHVKLVQVLGVRLSDLYANIDKAIEQNSSSNSRLG